MKEYKKTGVEGQIARLFPVLSETSKEGRAASILLACIQSVPPFADLMLSEIGRPVGVRSKLYCLTEVCLNGDKKFRPDGMIILENAKSHWKALLEFKVAGQLDKSQVENYLKVARNNNIDALITVSNDFAASPNIHPINVNGHLIGKVKLFHFSWTFIKTQCEIAINENKFEDKEQSYIISELFRFLDNKSTGIKGYEAMPACWPDVVNEITRRISIPKSDKRLEEISEGWLQEEKAISLILSRLTSQNCHVKRPRSHKDRSDIICHHISSLKNDSRLETEISVPNAAAPINIGLNIPEKILDISMKIKAPGDKKRASASINWLLRQLNPEEAGHLWITAHWPGRIHPTTKLLREVAADVNLLIGDNSKHTPHAFDISLKRQLKSGMASRKKVISELEKGVEEFYNLAGQNLRSWTPRPPKAKQKSEAEEMIEAREYKNEAREYKNEDLEEET